MPMTSSPATVATTSLYGWNGNDTLDGGDGIDQLFGGQGDDLYVIGNGDWARATTAMTASSSPAA